MSIFSVGAGGAAGAYTIDNSCRFNGTDSAYLKRTSSSAGNRKIWTASFWVKRGGPPANNQSAWGDQAFIAASDGSEHTVTRFTNNGIKLCLLNATSSPNGNVLKTTAVYLDPAAWYHVVFTVDTSQATAADRCKVFINGVEETDMDEESYPTQNTDWQMGDSGDYFIGQYSDNTNYANYYLADFNYVDGLQLTPASFAEANEDTNQWVPIEYTGAYGTNGCFLEFKDSSALGTDTSGNGNDFTVFNLVATDQMIDSPTNNFATMNPLASNGVILQDGNLKCDASAGGLESTGTLMPQTGKWYWELLLQNLASNVEQFGITRTTAVLGSTYLQGVNYRSDGDKFIEGTDTAYGATWTTGDIMAAAVDLDANTIIFYKNNVSQGSLSFTTGYDMIPMIRMGANNNLVVLNFGQDSSFSGAETAQGNGGDGEDFYYTPPSGYKALNTNNLPDPSIELSGAQFSQLAYDDGAGAKTGVGFQPDLVWFKSRGSANDHKLVDAVRGVTKAVVPNDGTPETTDSTGLTAFGADGFTVGADTDYSDTTGAGMFAWSWKTTGGAAVSKTYAVTVAASKLVIGGFSQVTVEMREGSTYTFDTSDSSVSGHTFKFATAADAAGSTEYTTGVTETGTPGNAGAKTVIVVAGSAPQLYYYCSVHNSMGGSANTNITAGSSNFDGSINSTVSVDTTGISIVKYTGTGSDSDTVGHGLGVVPEMIIVKAYETGTHNWIVWHKDLTATTAYSMYLNETTGQLNNVSYFDPTAPAATIFHPGDGGATNGSGTDTVAYCFNSVEGFSRIGSYKGDGQGDGPFIYTGFQVAWLIVKDSDGSTNWRMYNNLMPPYNTETGVFYANSNSAQVSSGHKFNLHSNGATVRGSWQDINTNGHDYIYAMFAEYPFKYTNAR